MTCPSSSHSKRATRWVATVFALVPFSACVFACELLERAGGVVEEEPAPRTLAGDASATESRDTTQQPESADPLTLRDFKQVTDGWEYVDRGGRFRAHVDHRGAVAFRRIAVKGPQPAEDGKILRFAGPSEVAEQLKGEPDLPARLAFMRRSEAVRAQIAQQGKAAELKQATKALHGELVALWRDTNTPVARRRQALFDRWDECATAGDPGIDEATAKAGEEARATILSFIAEMLPAGSPDAYSATELAQLNAKRRGKAAFEPYANRN